MRYWLFKSEPGTWSWDDQVAKGEKGEEWDGVRNYQARNNMREMKVGDRGFFYHSLKEKSIVGIVDDRWECVDIKAIGPMPTPVTLEDCKATPELSDMVLVNNTRLSVQPVTEREWQLICKMGGWTGG